MLRLPWRMYLCCNLQIKSCRSEQFSGFGGGPFYRTGFITAAGSGNCCPTDLGFARQVVKCHGGRCEKNNPLGLRAAKSVHRDPNCDEAQIQLRRRSPYRALGVRSSRRAKGRLSGTTACSQYPDARTRSRACAMSGTSQSRFSKSLRSSSSQPTSLKTKNWRSSGGKAPRSP